MSIALPKISADYGAGFGNGILIRGLPINICHPGQVFWVDANAPRTGRGTFKSPDVTFDAAIDRCVAGRGDIIYAKPGHSEDVDSTDWMDVDVDDIAIVGLGRGSSQAALNWVTTDSNFLTVSGDNVSFIGMRCENEKDDSDLAFRVTGDNFTFMQNYITAAANLGFETFMTVGIGTNGFQFIENRVDLGLDDDGESLVATLGTGYDIAFIGNRIVMQASTSIFDVDDDALTGTVLFQDNYLVNLTAAADYCVEIAGATVGIFVNERYSCAGAAEPATDLSASHCINCQGCDGVNQYSILWPKAATAWP